MADDASQPPAPLASSPTSVAADPAHHANLDRTLTTSSALAINLLDMIGVGPFITLPLIVTAMGGPQAMLGWLLGAALSLLDGMIWSELGTHYPEAGGSYAYLQHLYRGRLGRALAFLYAWQLLLSAPLSIASGCLGFSQYGAALLGSGRSHPLFAARWSDLPFIHNVLSVETLLALGLCLAATLVLHLRIGRLGFALRLLGGVVLGTLVWIIGTGLMHFSAARAFSFPPGAFHLNHAFFAGLGTGMLISAYDYWGYYNVCFLGAEVQNPRRTIPRAVLGSIALVALLYLLMNISVLGTVPWQAFATEGAAAQKTAMAIFMRQAYPGLLGERAATLVEVLTAFAAACSVLALLLGYSRIPFAAARDGNFPRMFGRLDPHRGTPTTSLRVLAGMTLFCCLFRLQEVISTLVITRILFQFLLQGIGILLPAHRSRRRTGTGFLMPLYPLPAVLALAGFSFILLSRPRLWFEIRPAAIVLLLGMGVYAAAKRRTPNANRA